jgi:hypothetical protein
MAGRVTSGGALLTGREWPVALVAAAGCVAATIALAAGHVAGPGAAALGAAVLVVVALWCLTERRVGRTLIVLGLYIGLLDGYLKLRTGARDVTIVRDVLLWAIAAGALWRASRDGGPLRLPPLGMIVVAFVVVVLAQLANPSVPGATQALAGVRQHLEFVPLFFLGYAFVRTRGAVRALLILLVAVAAANGAVGFVQSTLTPDQLAGWGPGYRDRVLGEGIFVGQNKVGYEVKDGVVTGVNVRPFGLGSEIGAGAVVAALAVPALMALVVTSAGLLRWILLLVCAPAVTLGVATAGSRAGLLACFVSAIAFGLLAAASRNALRVLVAVGIGVVLFAGTLALLSGDNGAARRARSVTLSNVVKTFTSERGDSVSRLDDYAVKYPLGLGVGTVGPAAHVLGTRQGVLDAETEWNLAVIETGIPGLFLLVVLGAVLVVLAFKRVRRLTDPDLRIHSAAVAAPLIAVFALSFAGPTTVSAPTAPYVWLAAGVLAYWLARPGPRAMEATRSQDQAE